MNIISFVTDAVPIERLTGVMKCESLMKIVPSILKFILDSINLPQLLSELLFRTTRTTCRSNNNDAYCYYYYSQCVEKYTMHNGLRSFMLIKYNESFIFIIIIDVVIAI